MEGLSTVEAKSKLIEILKKYKNKNKLRPIRNARLYVTKVWAFELFVYIYGVFLVFDYSFLRFSLESLITGIILLLLPFRYIYYRANRSKFQLETFDERIRKILKLLKNLQEGEDMSSVNLRTMNYTLVEVLRDRKWVKLPALVLVQGDIVLLKSGLFLPAPALGLNNGFENFTLNPYDPLPALPAPGECKKKTHFQILDSPSKLLLKSLLHDRKLKKKKTPTFFMVSLKLSRKIFIFFILSLFILNFSFSGIWMGLSTVPFSEFLVNCTFLYMVLMIIILPSLLHLLNCWGNALLWCICESLGNDSTENPRNSSKVQNSEQGFTSTERLGNIWSPSMAEKAESAFSKEEMISLFPPISISQCLSKCRSFIIGGLQRDLNILDLMNNSTVMSFIDKDGVISENSRYADEVIVMGPEGKILAFDLVHQSPQEVMSNGCHNDQILFIGTSWEESINSLKALGLATSVSRNPRIKDTNKNLINLNDDHPKIVNTGELFFETPKDQIEIFEECACILGTLMGFTNEAIEEYHHLCTLWSTWRPNECESLHDVSYRRIKKSAQNKEFTLSDYIEKRVSQAKRISAIQERLLRPYDLLTSIVEKDGKHEVFSQGNPKIVLQNCKSYWEGGDLRELQEDVLQQLNTALLQWTADDYDTIGFSYRPLNEEIEKIIEDRSTLENLDDATRELLQSVQREHIFLGMIAIINHPKSDANRFIEDVFCAGIRFVIFCEGDLLETKAFGDDLGLYTAWNSCISLSDKPAVIEEVLNQDGKKVLPQGIAEIKSRLTENSDNVPLLVSMFSDSSKSDILEMVKIYQQHGELPIVIGGCLHPQNILIYQAADISIGVKTLNCGDCKSCFGYKINYSHKLGIYEQVAEKLITLPCTFTLNIEQPLYVVLQVIKESRKLMKNIEDGLLFAACMYVCWNVISCICLIFGLPPIGTLIQTCFICFVVVPALALSLLSTPCEPNIMKKLPIKVDILAVVRKNGYYWYFVAKALVFIASVIQVHVWGLSLYQENFGFLNWNKKNELIIVQLCNFFYGVLLICVYSGSYLNRSQSRFHIRAINNFVWVVVAFVCLALTFIIIMVYLAVYQEFSDMQRHLKKGWYIYVTVFFELFLVVAVLELINYGVSRISKRLQDTLEVYFETKLGVYSPK